MEVQVWTVASLVSILHMEMQHMEMQVEVFRKPDGIKFTCRQEDVTAMELPFVRPLTMATWPYIKRIAAARTVNQVVKLKRLRKSKERWRTVESVTRFPE